MNPLRPLVQYYYNRIANRHLAQVLEQRFQQGKKTSNIKSKSVVSLALEEYLRIKGGDANNAKLDPIFVSYASWQVRVFLFAGTDSTSATMLWVFHMLFKYSDWLAKVQQEHSQVFGSDPSKAAQRLKENPSLINQCKITAAFIKETLRLYSPAGSTRAGMPGAAITDLKGNQHPVDYIGVNMLHQAIHMNPRVWPRCAEFLPERFLVEPGNELYPTNPAAFRAFELGPRNCIGQTLVWNELKVAVILICRELVIREAYDEFDMDRERTIRSSLSRRLWSRVFGGQQPLKTLNGDRVYQTDTAGMRPPDGYPCRVSWAEKASSR